MKGSDDVRKILSVMVGALLLLTTATPAGANTTSRSPVLMPDGRYRMDVSLLHVDYSNQLLTTNFSGDVIVVQYSDPTYGSQSIVVNTLEGTPLCADIAYRDSMPVTVTFNPGTTSEVTGTAKFGMIYSTLPETVATDLQRAKTTLQKARTKLKQARKNLRQARSKGSPREVRIAKRQVRLAKARVTSAKQRRTWALDAYYAVETEKEFCEARRLY